MGGNAHTNPTPVEDVVVETEVPVETPVTEEIKADAPVSEIPDDGTPKDGAMAE